MTTATLKDSILSLRHIYKTTHNFDLTYKQLTMLIFLSQYTEVYREQIYKTMRFMGYNDSYWQWWINNSYLVLDRIEKGKKIFKPTQKLYELISRLNNTLKSIE